MDNPDFKIPFNDLTNYVPQNLRKPVITSLIDNLFNRFLTHDESIPLYGYVGRKPTSLSDHSPRIPQSSPERDINSVIPVMSFKLGAEQVVFTVQDIIKKAEAIGVSPGGQQWLYSQGNNYLPPINIDKFTNFFNYYWVAKAVSPKPVMSWNPELAPEYYTIAPPKPSDRNKLNVVAASTEIITRTGTGFLDMSFNLTFSDATHFTISPIDSLGAYTAISNNFTLSSATTHIKFNVSGPRGVLTLIEFDVVRQQIYDQFGNSIGLAEFSPGDKFTIGVQFLTRLNSITFSGAAGVKGKLSQIKSLNVYQQIDGVTLRQGDRVLIKDGNPSETGIYIVSPGAWARAPDFNDDTFSVGARVFVQEGTINGSKMFRSFDGAPGFGWDIEPGITQSTTNEWQEGNYWVRGEDLLARGLARGDVMQAIRPIIEYDSAIQLNSFVNGGRPSSDGAMYAQIKTEFDQLPLFDLYRYDGTHSGLASSVFYYEEDPTGELDLALQKRLLKSTNDSADFVFNHGMCDNDGKLLFIKYNDALKTIWHAGFVEPTVVDKTYDGIGDGEMINISAAPFTQQQIWTITAISETQFKVSGSKMRDVSILANVDEVFFNKEIEFTITSGAIDFTEGDTFILRIGSLESPRFVTRDESTGDIIDPLYRNKAVSADSGAWQISRPFYNNPYNESREAISEGVLNSHFRSIESNQLPSVEMNHAFGGSIKLWSEQQTLLASLLMQRDMTPISMIDLAERQYKTALMNIRDIFQQNIVQFLGDRHNISNSSQLSKLLEFIQQIRSRDNDVRTVLFDTTSPLIGFPATLPQLGIAQLVEPKIDFDPILGVTVLIHHDGHESTLVQDDLEFRQRILGDFTALQIRRSDDTYTAAVGSFTSIPPARPFKGELWIKEDGSIFLFDVESDLLAPINPSIGTLWYKREQSQLFKWTGNQWALQTDTQGPWTQINFANILNDLILLVEQKLYNGINPNSRKFDFSAIMNNGAFTRHLKQELFSFAAINAYDPLAPDYTSSEPFTWNYSQSDINDLPALSVATVPARWHNILMAHQETFPTIIPTARPNMEPWKLFGFGTMLEWWTSLTPQKRDAYTPFLYLDQILPTFPVANSVKAVKTGVSATQRAGIIVVDGITLTNGDRILLTDEIDPNYNGIWVVSGGPWTQAADTLSQNLIVNVSSGNTNKDTIWILQDPVIVGDPINFRQVRTWSNELWADIKLVHPNLRLSVNESTDALLPPYVNSTTYWSPNALTTVIPTGANLGYDFGEDSPVEAVWKKTPEYQYSLARALFRFDPLAFLGFCWGFNWVEMDGILYDGFDMNMPGHRRFRLHGDAISNVARSPMISGPGTAPIVITYTAYDDQRKQNFTVTTNGTVLGYAQEGEISSFKGHTFTIEDEGIPFRMGDRFEMEENGDTIFVPISTYQYMGFGQTFTHALRETSIDTNSSYAVSAFREWDVNMGYRAGGLVATDDLQVYTNLETLSESAYELIFKRNPIARNEWVQALRIQVTRFGDVIKNQYGNTPVADGHDWTFRIEGYNSRYLDLTYYRMIRGSDVTFNALAKAHTDRQFLQPTIIAGIETTHLPLEIVGIQNVVDFLYGYSKYLEDRGWEFNQLSEYNIDAETGRRRNFQLEIEKFVDRCYAGIELTQGHVVNPFMERAWFNQKTGLLAEFIDTSLFDITGHPGAFDTLGVKYNKGDLDVMRTNARSSFGAEGPMFSAHIQIDEFEHIFIFNNYSQPSIGAGLLYHPFSGSRVVTYKFNGRKQSTNTMRPEFGGHFLVGNEVHQNLQASTDNIANFYDANHAFENETTTRHSLALLGFSTKAYFDNLDISNKTQFNFWRGLIQAKGTNLSVDAYLNSNRFTDAKIDEYWAYKVGTYGDARQHAFPELKLTTDDALTQFTRLQFDNDSLANLGFKSIESFDEKRWFSIDDLDQETYFQAEVVGTYSNIFSEDETYPLTVKLPFIADELIDLVGATRLNATTLLVAEPGLVTTTGYGPARPHFNPIKLFNYVDKELVVEIPMWHPAIGQHTPVALESINIISNQDPAKYNYAIQGANANTYDPLRPWGAREVGRVWFNTSNLSYLPYYDTSIFDLDERLSRWGTLSDFASVDVFEWIQSSVPPSEYDALALQQAGDANLDSQTKAAGEVAVQQTYVRERKWFMRPVAWSYSTVPVDVDWGATPPFPGGSTDADLLLSGGLASLSEGNFKQYNITAGMHLGAWNNDPIDPKPLSEYLIEDKFTKVLQDSQRNPFVAQNSASSDAIPSLVDIEITGYSDIVGQLIFSAVPITPIPVAPIGADINDADPVAWEIDAVVRLTEVGSGKTEYALVTSAIGTIGPTKERPYQAEQPYVKAVAHQEFRPANPGQPYITPIAAVPEITADQVVPATSGYQLLTFSEPVTRDTLTGAGPGPYVPKPPVTAPYPGDSVSWADAALVVIDGWATNIENIRAETIGGLIDLINSHFPFNPLSLVDGNIRVSSNTVGKKSNASFYGFVQFGKVVNYGLAVKGSDGVQAAPYKPAVLGQPFIPVDPGQPYIKEVVAQEYIPEILAVAAAPAPYLFGATISVVANEKFMIEFPSSGFTVIVTVNQAGTYPADVIRNAIVDALADRVIVRDAVAVTPIIAGEHTDLSNALDDLDDRPGWRVWNIPSQAALNADGQQPNSSWKAYEGDYAPIAGNLTQLQNAITYVRNPLILNNGVIVNRFFTEWAAWGKLENKQLTYRKPENAQGYDVARDGGSVIFSNNEKFDSVRTSVYINGIAQLKVAFSIEGRQLTVFNVPESAEVTIIIRKYDPTPAELTFNPDVKDDLVFQQQYKRDYDYVSLPVRDRNGSLDSNVYYFWVKNKTTASSGKKMSVQAIVNELRNGPNNFLTFQNFLPAVPGKPHHYDAVTIAGLNYIVSKDDTFKLRFTRNFTLRDDPDQLNLKNIHTEWSLMREGQKTKVPEVLWQKLTDSVAGIDAAGNNVPAIRRVLYDERNGSQTQYGFNSEQTLAPSRLLKSSITDTIVNTKLVETSTGLPLSNFILFLDLDERDNWFVDAGASRNTMTMIWNQASIAQINEIFFAALNDILASNYELDSIFKTSRLSAYSIKVVGSSSSSIQRAYE